MRVAEALPEICTTRMNDMLQEYNLLIAGLLLRFFTGTLFLFQGYDKLFKVGMPEVINTFMDDARRFGVPRGLVAVLSYYTSLAEFVGGIFLIVGFCTGYTVAALGLDLLIVAAAFSVVDPMWDLRHVFPRLVLLVAMLLLPQATHFFSVDAFLTQFSNKP